MIVVCGLLLIFARLLLLFDGVWCMSSFARWCLLAVGCLALVVVCCMMFGIWCLIVVCCVLFAVCCMMSGVVDCNLVYNCVLCVVW